MTVQIALCDDETAELDKTEEILSAYEQKHSSIDFMIERFESADELLNMVRERKDGPDLIFLTTSKEHALDAFDVEAFQYLLKPVQPDKLFSLLERFLKEAEEEKEKYILLRVEGMLTRVSLHDVVYCEAQGKYQCIYLADGTEVPQNLTMAKIYEMCSLCQELVKVGASYIVHLGHIVSLNAKEAQMDNGQKIYLPRGAYRLLREQYLDYYCGKEE